MSTANPRINYRAFQLLQYFFFFFEVFPGVPDLFNKELLGNLNCIMVTQKHYNSTTLSIWVIHT